jgi:hypothetical protein
MVTVLTRGCRVAQQQRTPMIAARCAAAAAAAATAAAVAAADAAAVGRVMEP